mgnify:CR=1 FL=1
MTRFEEIPDGIIFEMQRTVKKYFPDWQDNVLLKHYVSMEQRMLCLLIDFPFKKGDKEEVSKVLRFIGGKCQG